MSLISRLTTLGAAGAGGESYYISILQSSSSSNTVYQIQRHGVIEGASGEVASVANVNYSNNSRGLIYVTNPDGSLKFQKLLDEGSTQDTESWGVTRLGSDYYWTLEQRDNGIGHTVLAKISSSGSLVWQKSQGYSTSRHVPNGIANDGTYIYQCGDTRNAGTAGEDESWINAYNTSGTLQWTRIFNGGQNNQGWTAEGVSVDDSGNIYTVTRGFGISGGNNGSGESNVSIDKWNSSGTHTGQATFGHQYTDTPRTIKFDSNGNAYLLVYYQAGPSGSGTYLVKLNSSLVQQWTMYLSPNSMHDIAVDSNDDIIISCGHNVSSRMTIAIVKINSSGTIQYQKELKHSTGELLCRSINFTANDDIILTGQAYGFGQFAIHNTKLRGDGTGNGTYGNFTYSDTTVYSASSVTNATVSNNDFSNKTVSVNTGTAPTLSITDHSLSNTPVEDLT